jgi:hypothetical protein
MNILNDFEQFSAAFSSLPGNKLENTIAVTGIVAVSMLGEGKVSQEAYDAYKDLIGALIAAAKEVSKSGPIEVDFTRVATNVDTLLDLIRVVKMEGAQ